MQYHVMPGNSNRRYVAQLHAALTSKRSEKYCEIPDGDLRWEYPLGLTLHQMMSFYEDAMWYDGALVEVSRQANNLLLANLGFVVSEGESRRFVSIPICVEDYLVFTEADASAIVDPHSEDLLYCVLLNNKHLQHLVDELLALLTAANSKVYALVLDIHSTKEICQDCEKVLCSLQQDYQEGSFLYQIEAMLAQAGLRLPKEKITEEVTVKPRLPLMIRASCREQYLSKSKERLTLSSEELEMKHLASAFPTVLIHSIPTEEKVTLANVSHNTRRQPCREQPNAQRVTGIASYLPQTLFANRRCGKNPLSVHASLTQPWEANLDDGIMQAAYIRAMQIAK